MSEAALELIGLGAAHGAQPILDAVDLRVEPGEFIAVLGASGSGKSTLLRVLAGLMPANRGELLLGGLAAVRDGRERVPAEARQVGMVFQDYALFPTLCVADNVGFGLHRPDPHRVREMLRLTGLEHLADRLPSELSGGQQQRVALARALAPRPRVLLLDEPFANIDVAHRQELGSELAALVRHEGVTVMLVTHDHQEALLLADRVAILVPGDAGARLAQVDVPERVWAQPADLDVARLFGPLNLIPGHAHATGEGTRIDTVLGELRSDCALRGEVEVLLRPELLRFVASDDGACVVEEVGYLGGRWRLRCRQAGRTLVALGEGIPPVVGQCGDVRVVAPVWAFATALSDDSVGAAAAAPARPDVSRRSCG